MKSWVAIEAAKETAWKDIPDDEGKFDEYRRDAANGFLQAWFEALCSALLYLLVVVFQQYHVRL